MKTCARHEICINLSCFVTPQGIDKLELQRALQQVGVEA